MNNSLKPGDLVRAPDGIEYTIISTTLGGGCWVLGTYDLIYFTSIEGFIRVR